MMRTDREKMIDLLDDAFEKEHCKRGLITARHTADHLIQNGVTTSEWLRIAERLPDIDTTVIVCDAETGQMHTATFDGKLWHLDGGWLLDQDDFTHWMSLPELPKGVEPR